MAAEQSTGAGYGRTVITMENVRDAAARITGVAHHTPVLSSRTLDVRVDASVALKAENLQRAGSFKIRGAYNRISRLTPDELERGVVAYSSGNHAQAVALAASLVGTRAVIVMPEDSPTVKRAATEGYGAEIVTYDRATGDRHAIGSELAAERGMTLVPPYEDPLVMAGQGTVALELIEDAGRLDVLLVPVGGGGLIAGCATAATALLHRVRVIGVEPEAADDTRRSLEAGRRVQIPAAATLCDGLMATTPGELTFSVNQRLLDSVVTVTEDEVLAATLFLWERTKLVVEPSGAVGVAALLAGRIDIAGQRVGCVLSGGNVDLGAVLGALGALTAS